MLCHQIEVGHCPLNGDTVNVVRLDLDLHFQGNKYWNVNISKTLRASEKCSSTTFIEVDICYRMDGNIANLFHELDPNFQGQTFQVTILRSKSWNMRTLLLPSDRKSGICHRTAPLQMLFSTNLTLNYQGQTFQTLISLKLWELV